MATVDASSVSDPATAESSSAGESTRRTGDDRNGHPITRGCVICSTRRGMDGEFILVTHVLGDSCAGIIIANANWDEEVNVDDVQIGSAYCPQSFVIHRSIARVLQEAESVAGQRLTATPTDCAAAISARTAIHHVIEEFARLYVTRIGAALSDHK